MLDDNGKAFANKTITSHISTSTDPILSSIEDAIHTNTHICPGWNIRVLVHRYICIKCEIQLSSDLTIHIHNTLKTHNCNSAAFENGNGMEQNKVKKKNKQTYNSS